MVSEMQYVHSKSRSEYGKQCFFSDDAPKLLESVMPNKALFNDYIVKNPMDASVEIVKNYSEHEVNTTRAEFVEHGMNHVEGGWPRDINPCDAEQTGRFKKKIEKDETYIHTILQLSNAMEHNILQNNSVNIYEIYFKEYNNTAPLGQASARTVNVFRDTCNPARPVSHLSWSADGGTKVAVSHCNLDFQRSSKDFCSFSYIWNVENTNRPLLTLKPAATMPCVEYNPKDPNFLVSGLYNGQVAAWDVRKGSNPVNISVLENSHQDPALKVLWINSKSGTEFFSASPDGQVKWWDTRDLSQALETFILDMTKGDEPLMSRAMGASSLEYEPTIPTRFLVGTENGRVISCNRKGKTQAERLPNKFECHLGPVYAVQRNPTFVKNFLTIGDWTARIWAEDCKESCIMWTCFHRSLLTDGAWSPTRYSVFYTTKVDGTLDVWDILQQQREPILSVKVCDDHLQCLRIQENGQLVAVGNNMGITYLVEMSENLSINQKNDKPLLTHMLDREGRREKILEARGREMKLKQKKGGDMGKEKSSMIGLGPDTSTEEKAEEEFFKVIEKELQKRLAQSNEDEEQAEGKGGGDGGGGEKVPPSSA